MKHAIALTLLVTAACQPPAEAPAPAEDDHLVTADGDDLPALQQLLPQGEYRLAGANGSEVNLGHAITVSVTEDMIETVSQCVTQRWTYRYSDDRLQTEPIIEPVCDRGRYPAEEAIRTVFDNPQEVLRTPENGIYIAGGGQSITLFSQ